MDQSRLDVAQLQQRNPAAWTNLLRLEPELTDVVVTAVAAQPLYKAKTDQLETRVVRYLLNLDNCSDPISLIGKQTNRTELVFYRNVASQIPGLAPRCWFNHLDGQKAWIILDDVPDDYPPAKWDSNDVEAIIHELSRLHAHFWQQNSQMQSMGFTHFISKKRYSLDELKRDHKLFFEEGPAAILSEHAIHSGGELAPLLLQAANGLAVIRSLDGWPGIMGESHLTAAADLLDDPLPMLQPLRDLPVTLLHGNPFSYHWRSTFWGERCLLDWQKTAVGPGICDLVNFMEQFDLLYASSGRWPMQMRPEWPLSEETMVDSYLLSLSAKLGPSFNARAMRQAISAARCLYVIINWFPYFAGWFADMPNKYTWQKINRMTDEQLIGTAFEPIAGFRPYLAGVFQRFLQSYRML
ncbi:MAG: hypothetical protein H6667_23265 [Ardenticatenaceae bacterium]|nr:hypothetical protein [Ardenticatenaceae bacterium]